jgi:sigma-B regulation protein RsbU (phosphoserine phosphatase)
VHHYARRGIRDYDQRYRLVTRSGEIRWVDDRTIIRVDSSGTVTHHQGIITDVTEMKIAELREDERREADLRVAGEIQYHMLPAEVPHQDEIEVESRYLPSSLLGGGITSTSSRSEIGRSGWW